MTTEWIDHGKFWEHNAPQGSDEWLGARTGRVTTSVSGAMVGISKFKTPEQQGRIIAGIEEEVFTEEEIEIMGHGTATESPVRNWYKNLINQPIVERGLIVPKWDLTIGASVDGDIVGTDGIIEIKCPVNMYRPLEQYMDQKSVGWVHHPGYKKHIWPTHFSQMQHAMAVMDKKWCVYIVCSTIDQKIFTQKIHFDQEYWDNHYSILKSNQIKYIDPHLKPGYPICP